MTQAKEAVAKPTRGRIFAGWWVVLGGTSLHALTGTLLFNAFGAYFVPLQSEFGWSRTMVSFAYSIQQVESGLLGPLQGWLLDRFGPRTTIRLGLILMAIGFLLFSQITELLPFYGSFLVVALGSSLSGYLPLSITVVNWFSRKRATATAFLQAGMSISGLMVPFVALSLSNYGWRATALGSAVLFLVIGLPLTMLIRRTPEDYGLLPDGDRERPETAARAVSAADYTLRQAMRTPSYWLLALGHASGAVMFTSVNVHLVSAVTQIFQVPIEVAAGAIALVTGVSLATQLPGGLIGDRFNKRAIAMICMAFQLVGFVFLALASSWWMIVVFAVLHGAAVGIRGPLMTAIRADYFGRSSLGQIMGVSSLVVSAGTILGPLTVGYLADLTGSYQIGFGTAGLAAIVGLLSFLFARKPAVGRSAS